MCAATHGHRHRAPALANQEVLWHVTLISPDGNTNSHPVLPPHHCTNRRGRNRYIVTPLCEASCSPVRGNLGSRPRQEKYITQPFWDISFNTACLKQSGYVLLASKDRGERRKCTFVVMGPFVQMGGTSVSATRPVR